MNHPINRRPTTLATRSPKLWENVWDCARHRASLAAQDRSNSAIDRAIREYGSAHAAYVMMETCRKPAFPPCLPNGIDANQDAPRFDRLTLNRRAHIAAAMNSEPVTVPDYLSEAMCDSEDGWQEKVCRWLSINDDSEAAYVWHFLTIGAGESDLSGYIEMTYFVCGSGDQFWQPFWAVIDGELYDCTDSTIAESCILDCMIGWHLLTLDDEELPRECRADRFSAGYSSNPTHELSEALFKDCQPAWHWGFNCFVGRIKQFAEPVKMFPEVPYYGG